jgi:hypothetical protein
MLNPAPASWIFICRRLQPTEHICCTMRRRNRPVLSTFVLALQIGSVETNGCVLRFPLLNLDELVSGNEEDSGCEGS